MLETREVVADFAAGKQAVDAMRPQAWSHNGKRFCQPGSRPHSESATTRLVTDHLIAHSADRYRDPLSLEVPFRMARQTAVMWFSALRTPPGGMAIELKRLRVMGDNGKSNDNILNSYSLTISQAEKRPHGQPETA